MLIKELLEHYNIKRTALYDRLKAANITPNKDQNNRSYITQEDLKKLDAVDWWLKDGGSLKTFMLDSPVEVIKEENLDIIDNPSVPIESIIELTKAILQQQKPDPITQLEKKYRFLAWAASTKTILSTKEVKILIQVTPKGTQFKRGSFTFIKVGKIGNQSAWKIDLMQKKKM